MHRHPTQELRSARPSTFDPLTIDSLDDADLDALPFGVICLDPSGIILRYNQAEARLARLDRDLVIGRDFFTEIAPCTRTEEFEGRFRALRDGGADRSVVRFEYLFDFKFGAQRVSIEMVRPPGVGRVYCLVNRQEFMAPRAEARAPAPRLDELQGPGDELGSVRDERAQRSVHTNVVFFQALLRTCDAVAPETWPLFCHEWGVEWGRRVVVELETLCLEQTVQSLKERSMREVSTRLASYVQEQGWGDLSFDFGLAQRGVVKVDLERSLLAAASRIERGQRCQLMAGLVQAVFAHLANRRLFAAEIGCRCQGRPRCEFVLLGASRREQLEAWVEEGRAPEEIMERLAQAGGRGVGAS